jgi:hypothetical protein
MNSFFKMYDFEFLFDKIIQYKIFESYYNCI